MAGDKNQPQILWRGPWTEGPKGNSLAPLVGMTERQTSQGESRNIYKGAVIEAPTLQRDDPDVQRLTWLGNEHPRVEMARNAAEALVEKYAKDKERTPSLPLTPEQKLEVDSILKQVDTSIIQQFGKSPEVSPDHEPAPFAPEKAPTREIQEIGRSMHAAGIRTQERPPEPQQPPAPAPASPDKD